MVFKNIAYIKSDHKESREIFDKVSSKIKIIDINKLTNPDLIIVIGGDGTLLHSIHRYMHLNIPFYGINTGSLGFLMNVFKEDFYNRIINSRKTILHPLIMEVQDIEGIKHKKLAINEVSLYRNTNHIVRLKIFVDDVEQISLWSDGVIISTPAGSSAYNFSAGGRIIPLSSNILSVTPICTFRPRRWNGALLPSNSQIIIKLDETSLGKANATSDFNEVKNITEIKIHEDSSKKISLLFDDDHSLEQRFIKEQFLY